LGTLHTILWPGADWKPISLGDLLDDAKVKKAYHKASRVVHPDKTHHLPPEQRFLSKRIFDALTQAKTEFDEGK
jgi:cyclin G-associated kinase